MSAAAKENFDAVFTDESAVPPPPKRVRKGVLHKRDNPDLIKCAGTGKHDKPCGNWPLTGSKYCRAHQPAPEPMPEPVGEVPTVTQE